MTRAQVVFTPAVGSAINLRDPNNGRVLTEDIDGIDMPPVAFDESALFDQQGARLNTIRFQPREVTVPIAVFADTQENLRTRCRALVTAMNPRLGDGMLTIKRDNGSDAGRVLFCRYVKGLEGTMEVYDIGDGWWVAAPVFRGFDPYFYGPEVTHNFTGDTVDNTINFFPIFADAADVGPHFGTSNIVTSGDSVTNPGDDIVFPVWTIEGPITNLVLHNTSTGQAMDFTANGGLVLGASDTLTIDSRDFPIIVDQNGNNKMPYLQPASVPFALGMGVNNIEVGGSVIGAGSSVSLRFRPPYLSA